MIKLCFLLCLSFFIGPCWAMTEEEPSDREYKFKTMKEVYTTCYEELGCIVTNSSWCSLVHRPVVMKPDERKVLNTTFFLFKRDKHSDTVQSIMVNSSNITPNQISPSLTTFVIVHGYLSSGQASWVKELALAILKRGNYNVISVDWMIGAYRFYPKSVSNTRIVALELSYFLNSLLKRKMISSPSNIHLIGHSLGAHICGYVGANISHIRRITGLDPAGPYFQYMPNNVKLDPGDADRVVVLHTDPSIHFLTGYGTAELSGHLDIFANDMRTTQPGCFGRVGGPISDFITVSGISISNFASKIRSIIKGNNYTETIPPYERVSCSHSRSIDYFIEAISSESCEVVPFECDFFSDFVEGKCNGCGDNYEKCIKFDLQFHSLPKRWQIGRRFLFFTGRKKPFCVTTYSVSIKLHKDTTGCSGTFNIALYNKTGKIDEKLHLNSGHKLHFKPDTLVNTLTFSQINVPAITKIDFTWKTGIFSKVFDVFRKMKKQLVIEYVEIQNMGMIPHAKPIRLCPKALVPLHIGKTQSFKGNYCNQSFI